MLEKIKQIINGFWKWLVATGIIGGIVLAAPLVTNDPIPAHLQLKVSADNVLSSRVVDDTVYYAYNSGEDAPALDSEIIGKRTPHVVYRNLGGKQRSAQSGYSFHKDNLGAWKKVKFATTTKDMFDRQTVGIGLITKIFAADTGATSPGTTVEDTSVGSNSFDVYNNVQASDDTRATASVTNAVFSYYIKATNFGFSIPSGATIDGVVASIEGQSGNNPHSYANNIRLVKGGTIQGDTKTTPSFTESVDETETAGGASDLWGLTLTDSDVNASTFGFASSYGKQAGQGNGDMIVDHVTLTIYYTESSDGGVPLLIPEF